MNNEKYCVCCKGVPYDEKFNIFQENINMTLKNSPVNNSIIKQKLNDVYGVLKNKNVIVPHLPIFRYNNKLMSVIGRDNDNIKHGKTMILTVSDINRFLNKKYIVFLYNVLCVEYNKNNELKYRVVVLDES